MPDLQALFDESASAMRAAGYWSTRTARLMIGVPDYETYVAHRQATHPDQPIMTYVGSSTNASKPATLLEGRLKAAAECR